MNLEGKIISATPGKSGVNQNTGKKWQIIEVVVVSTQNPQGEMFNSFDDQYLRMVGREGSFEYTENQYGKTLGRLPRQYESKQNTQVMEELGKLSRKLDEVLELVSIRTPVRENKDTQIPF